MCDNRTALEKQGHAPKANENEMLGKRSREMMKRVNYAPFTKTRNRKPKPRRAANSQRYGEGAFVRQMQEPGQFASFYADE